MSYETDYEITYNTNARMESEKEYIEALKSAKAERAGKTSGILQTGNTGPSGTPQEVGASEKSFESIAAYLEYLQNQYTGSIFTIGNFNGGASELNGIGGILLSPKFMEKMIDDSAFRAKMEKSIAEIVDSEKSLKLWYESNNSKVLGHGAVIDDDGQAKTWSFVLEDLNSMEKLGSTSAYMQMEDLREKAMKLDV